MYKTPKIIVVIPARLGSVRLPGKPLIDVEGLPMIEHVRRRAQMSSLSDRVVVASGDEAILQLIRQCGGKAFQSCEEHLNGLSRAAEVVRNSLFTHAIILQGDEILILPEQLDALSDAIHSNPQIDFWNGICDLESTEDLYDTSVVKCTLKLDGNIQTIFRHSPLTTSLENQLKLVKKICGLFAISASLLAKFSHIGPSPIENSESIEQMRLLEHSWQIGTFDMKFNYPSVNLSQDLIAVNKILNTDRRQRELLDQTLYENQS